MINDGSVMVDVIDTLEGFDSIRADWERLEQASHLRIFQTYLWCRNAWDCYLSKEKGARLWILRWHRDGCEDYVIFPFYIDCKRCLRFIMDGHSDVCDAVYNSLGNNRYWTYREVCDLIKKTSNISAVRLQKMYSKSEMLDYLGVLLPGAVTTRDNAFSWIWLEKSSSFNKSFAFMKSKDRADIKAILRKAENKTIQVFSARKGDPFPESLVCELILSMRKNKIRHKAFFPKSLLDFVRNIYNCNGLQAVALFDANDCVAINFMLEKDNRFLSWIFLYTDNRASTELYAKYLSDESRSHSFVFDFGVGVYDYKLGSYRPAMGITFSLRYAKSLWWQLRELLQANIRLLKDILKPR